MRLLNAYYGVRKLRIAQILGIIATAVSVLMLLIMLPDGGRERSGVLLLLALAVFGLSIAILVMELSGVSQASRDERSFHKAMTVLIAALVIGFVDGFVNQLLGDDSPLDFILELAGKIVSIAGIYYIIQGIARLAVRLKDLPMAERGNRLFRLLLILQCSSLAVSIASKFISSGSSGGVLVTILLCAVFVLYIVGSVLYLRYLLQTEQMLLSRQIEQVAQPSGPAPGEMTE